MIHFWRIVDVVLGWSALIGAVAALGGLCWALNSTHWLATVLITGGAVIIIAYFRYSPLIDRQRDEAEIRRDQLAIQARAVDRASRRDG